MSKSKDCRAWPGTQPITVATPDITSPLKIVGM
jgi:hypothetical protein